MELMNHKIISFKEPEIVYSHKFLLGRKGEGHVLEYLAFNQVMAPPSFRGFGYFKGC